MCDGGDTARVATTRRTARCGTMTGSWAGDVHNYATLGVCACVRLGVVWSVCACAPCVCVRRCLNGFIFVAQGNARQPHASARGNVQVKAHTPKLGPGGALQPPGAWTHQRIQSMGQHPARHCTRAAWRSRTAGSEATGHLRCACQPPCGPSGSGPQAGNH